MKFRKYLYLILSVSFFNFSNAYAAAPGAPAVQPFNPQLGYVDLNVLLAPAGHAGAAIILK